MYYAQMVKGLAGDNKSSLAAIGITVGDDARLSFDAEKFKKASEEEIKKALGAESDFMQKLSYISEHIADNARANANSIISQYNASGASRTSAYGGVSLIR